MHPALTFGFRPFYLLAAAFAAGAIPLWVAAWTGSLALQPALPGSAWHVHEMVFGFAPAVIAGFLLTAVRAWTGRPTLQGLPLFGLALLWLAARAAMLTGPAELALVLDLAFLPLVALAVLVPLWQARNRRNAFVVVLLLALAAASATHHGAWRGWLDPAWATRAWVLGLDLVALLITVIAGRIIPVFAGNAITGYTSRRWPVIEWAAPGLLVVMLMLDASGATAQLPAILHDALVLTAAAVHLTRLLGWRPWVMRHNPLLLVLPLGYVWLPVHLALRVLDPPGGMATAAAHALAIGAMAGLMLAMMTRSSRGHTGRPLLAGRADLVAFGAMHAAVVARLCAHAVPGLETSLLVVAGGLWSLAFAAFAVRYAPWLLQPRADA